MLGLFEFIFFLVSLACFYNFTFESGQFGCSIISLTVVLWIGNHWYNEYQLFFEGKWETVNCKQLRSLDYIDNWYDDYEISNSHQRYMPQQNSGTTIQTVSPNTIVTSNTYRRPNVETTVDIIAKTYHRKSIEKVGEPIIKHVERPSKLLSFFGVNTKVNATPSTVVDTTVKTATDVKTETIVENNTSPNCEVIMIYNDKHVNRRLRRIYDKTIKVLKERLGETTMFHNVLCSMRHIDYANGVIYVYIADKYILDNDDILPKNEIIASLKKEMGESVSVKFLEYNAINIKEYYDIAESMSITN